ncbi:hypothetical protein MY04_5464 [Flammeovirga sp. MY04]|uniref:hypothetical protein n=1 Tax=Flammeovirga sp. MY04 TaxID=1191459 RepID=UPI0008063B0B|nr:hypothetical protein [Flammeovirga sp. MY04]ANQ52795.1 hypothetical protein MY04_5464 [Flammeovirga sp. MY04]
MREFSDDMIYLEIYRFISHKSQNEHTLVYYLNTFDDLLFQPTSKSRYVPFYELIANIYLKHSDINELYKKRLIYQLENINKNWQGTIASNFRYEHDGKINHLFDLKSPFTLVVFTNSECNNCINNYKAMSNSKDI